MPLLNTQWPLSSFPDDQVMTNWLQNVKKAYNSGVFTPTYGNITCDDPINAYGFYQCSDAVCHVFIWLNATSTITAASSNTAGDFAAIDLPVPAKTPSSSNFLFSGNFVWSARSDGSANIRPSYLGYCIRNSVALPATGGGDIAANNIYVTGFYLTGN